MRDTTAWLRSTGSLPYVAQYHQLRLRKEFGQLSAREAWEMEMLRDLFEPRELTPEGITRAPLRIPLQREARVMTAISKLPAQAEVLELRLVELSLTRRLPTGLSLRVAIAGPRGQRWFRFAGRILHPLSHTSGVAVELESFLGCEAVEAERISEHLARSVA